MKASASYTDSQSTLIFLNQMNQETATRTQTQEQSQSNSVNPVDSAAEQAQQVIQGLDAAGLHYAAAAIQRQANKLETESDNLAKTIGQLANPKLLLALSYLKAGQLVDEDLSSGVRVGVQTFPKPKLNLPSVPAFGQYYSLPDLQDGQRQLTSGRTSATQCNSTEDRSNSSDKNQFDQPVPLSAHSSNGNSKTVQSKGFGNKVGS